MLRVCFLPETISTIVVLATATAALFLCSFALVWFTTIGDARLLRENQAQSLPPPVDFPALPPISSWELRAEAAVVRHDEFEMAPASAFAQGDAPDSSFSISSSATVETEPVTETVPFEAPQTFEEQDATTPSADEQGELYDQDPCLTEVYEIYL